MSIIQTASGGKFDFAAPSQNILTVEDVAHALAAERRYVCSLNIRRPAGFLGPALGLTRRGIYTVAEHSVHVYRMVRDTLIETSAKHQRALGKRVRASFRDDGNLLRWALAHDGTEAIVRDFPGPGKDYVAGYRAMEAAVLDPVSRAFNMRGPEPPIVKHADTIVGKIERWHFRGTGDRPTDDELRYRPLCWPEDLAKARFLQAWDEVRSL